MEPWALREPSRAAMFEILFEGLADLKLKNRKLSFENLEQKFSVS